MQIQVKQIKHSDRYIIYIWWAKFQRKSRVPSWKYKLVQTFAVQSSDIVSLHPNQISTYLYPHSCHYHCRCLSHSSSFFVQMPQLSLSNHQTIVWHGASVVAAMMNDASGTRDIRRDPSRFKSFFVTKARYASAPAWLATTRPRTMLTNRFPKLFWKTIDHARRGGRNVSDGFWDRVGCCSFFREIAPYLGTEKGRSCDLL